MTYCDSKLKIFTCNSNPKLAHQIADYIGIPMGESHTTSFSDGEIRLSCRKAYASLPCVYCAVNLSAG